jgi:hypothetical protein
MGTLVHVVRVRRVAAAMHHPLSPRTSMSEGMASPAVRAPEFPDTLDWLHTGGRRLTLGDFRGTLLLLDFWTYG